MWQRIIVVGLTVFMIGLFAKTSAEMKVRRVQCIALEKNVGVFEECYVKPISRNKRLTNIRYRLKGQVNSSIININIVKRANGWKPFLYNITFDACDFIARPQKYMIAYYLYLIGKPFTDINHTCPYKAGSAMSLKNFVLSEPDFLSYAPIDIGDYGLQTLWYSNKGPNPVAAFNVYMTYSDYSKT